MKLKIIRISIIIEEIFQNFMTKFEKGESKRKRVSFLLAKLNTASPQTYFLPYIRIFMKFYSMKQNIIS